MPETARPETVAHRLNNELVIMLSAMERVLESLSSSARHNREWRLLRDAWLAAARSADVVKGMTDPVKLVKP